MAEVVSLAAARQRKLARESAAAKPGPEPRTLRPLGTTDLWTESGHVVMAVPHSHGTAEVPFTPDQARIWAERLLMLADSAEAVSRG